jgi:hypothetical protein
MQSGKLGHLWKTSIIVIQADDVVFADIRSALHLDQVQRNLAGILQAMNNPDRHVS